MNIGLAAKLSELPVKTVRYYESIGLVVPQRTLENGYRDYSQADIELLVFLRRARVANLSLEECALLLSVLQAGGVANTGQQAIVESSLMRAAQLVRDLNDFQTALRELSNVASGDSDNKDSVQRPQSGMSFMLVDGE